MKQGNENTEFVKEAENSTEKYIFQKNAKTKFGFTFIVTILVLLIASIVITALYLL